MNSYELYLVLTKEVLIVHTKCFIFIKFINTIRLNRRESPSSLNLKFETFQQLKELKTQMYHSKIFKEMKERCVQMNYLKMINWNRLDLYKY